MKKIIFLTIIEKYEYFIQFSCINTLFLIILIANFTDFATV